MKNFYKLLPFLAIGMILCFPTLSNAQTKKKRTPSTSANTWVTYTINTQDNLKRIGVMSIKFPITPNQTSRDSNHVGYRVDYKGARLFIDANYIANFQSLLEEGRMFHDLLPENYGRNVVKIQQSQSPQDKYNLISYKTLPLGMDETKYSVVDSDGKVFYVRMRAAMRNRTLFQMACSQNGSLDDALCDKFFKSFSFTYKK
jgi:hypothetical protein